LACIGVAAGDIAQAPERDNGSTPVIVVQPDGPVAALGRPGSLESVTGYVRDLFSDPAAGSRPPESEGPLIRADECRQQCEM
jgi:hypothetical protein